MIKSYIDYSNKIISSKKLFLFSIWFSFFVSINLNPNDYESFNLINKLRLILPLILIFICLFVLKINYRALLKFDALILIFLIFLYFLFTLVNFDDSRDFITCKIAHTKSNLFWPTYMFLSFFFIVSFVEKDEMEFLIKGTIFILFIVFFAFMSFAIDQMIEQSIGNFYGIWGGSGYGPIEIPPRSSGLARYALILFSFFYTYYLTYNKNKKHNLLLFFISLLGFLTLTFQSRIIIILFILINFLMICIYFEEIKKKKLILLFALILPITLSYGFEVLKNTNTFIVKNNEKPTGHQLYDITTSSLNSLFLRNEKHKDINSFTSGRLNIWKISIDIIKQDPFVGYGAQADRLLILNQQSVHNAILYSWLCGGIISAIIILFYYLKGLYFFINFLKSKNYKKNLFVSSSLLIIIIIFLRSLFETSFAVYSIDYLVFLITFYYMKNSIKHN